MWTKLKTDLVTIVRNLKSKYSSFIVNGRTGDNKIQFGKSTFKYSSVVDYCICTCSVFYPLANEIAMEYSNATVRPSSPPSVRL